MNDIDYKSISNRDSYFHLINMPNDSVTLSAAPSSAGRTEGLSLLNKLEHVLGRRERGEESPPWLCTRRVVS